MPWTPARQPAAVPGIPGAGRLVAGDHGRPPPAARRDGPEGSWRGPRRPAPASAAGTRSCHQSGKAPGCRRRRSAPCRWPGGAPTAVGAQPAAGEDQGGDGEDDDRHDERVGAADGLARLRCGMPGRVISPPSGPAFADGVALSSTQPRRRMREPGQPRWRGSRPPARSWPDAVRWRWYARRGGAEWSAKEPRGLCREASRPRPSLPSQ